MSRPTTTTSAAAVKKDLLARIGLTEGADEQAIEAAHSSITEYLDAAPDDLRGWADRRQREADRIHILLTGPEADLEPLAARPAPAAAAPVRRLSKPVLWLGGVAAVIALIVGVYFIGRPPSSLPAMTAAEASATPSAAGLDQAKVAALMAKIQANPKDVESLQALSDLYYQAQDFTNAKVFISKVLDVDPKNEKALIGLGALDFNVGDLESAEKVWKQAVALYPNNPEVHYDLGFLYMTKKQTDLMQQEWAKVIELAPDSDLAKNVQSHVGSVKTPSPTPSTSK
jgi:tetratricopeptide (TPR) repeat protein